MSNELADAITSLLHLRSDVGQFDVRVGMAEFDVRIGAPAPLVEITIASLGRKELLAQAEGWQVLDSVLSRVPIQGLRGSRPVNFGAKPDHDSVDLPWGIYFTGEAWARYGDARGVLTYRSGATRWRDRAGDPGKATREFIARQRFSPDLLVGLVDARAHDI